MQEVLRKLLQRLTRLAKTAEDFRALTSPGWAPRIGAYMCAAHWLAHSLQEAAGPLLLLDLEGDWLFLHCPCHYIPSPIGILEVGVMRLEWLSLVRPWPA